MVHSFKVKQFLNYVLSVISLLINIFLQLVSNGRAVLHMRAVMIKLFIMRISITLLDSDPIVIIHYKTHCSYVKVWIKIPCHKAGVLV